MMRFAINEKIQIDKDKIYIVDPNWRALRVPGKTPKYFLKCGLDFEGYLDSYEKLYAATKRETRFFENGDLYWDYFRAGDGGACISLKKKPKISSGVDPLFFEIFSQVCIAIFIKLESQNSRGPVKYHRFNLLRKIKNIGKVLLESLKQCDHLQDFPKKGGVLVKSLSLQKSVTNQITHNFEFHFEIDFGSRRFQFQTKGDHLLAKRPEDPGFGLCRMAFLNHQEFALKQLLQIRN